MCQFLSHVKNHVVLKNSFSNSTSCVSSIRFMVVEKGKSRNYKWITHFICQSFLVKSEGEIQGTREQKLEQVLYWSCSWAGRDFGMDSRTLWRNDGSIEADRLR